ncbi:unnamed protein product [Chironomus riparius]|uniref:Ubiquitin-like domain-containing protein n=1 Tax=Chironomus riparius TaxID=315576 RepID=A0A9N9X033_9DIPT|nr:unnamed protein product [Chironomus riparius]
MQIKIKEINGDEFLIQIEPTETVAALKSKIEIEKKISTMEMKLLFSGKVLQDDKTLDDYKVSETSKIMLTRVKVDLKSLVQKVLTKYYDSEKAASIATLVVANMKKRVQEYSLDDVERLAESWNQTR